MKAEPQNGSLPDDSEILEIIRKGIALRGYPALRQLSLANEQGVITIRGRCPSYYLCQIAIESAKRVPGVVRVHSQIKVVYDSTALDEQVHDLRSVQGHYPETPVPSAELSAEPFLDSNHTRRKSEDDLPAENRSSFAARVDAMACYIGAETHD